MSIHYREQIERKKVKKKFKLLKCSNWITYHFSFWHSKTSDDADTVIWNLSPLHRLFRNLFISELMMNFEANFPAKFSRDFFLSLWCHVTMMTTAVNFFIARAQPCCSSFDYLRWHFVVVVHTLVLLIWILPLLSSTNLVEHFSALEKHIV